MITIEVRRDGRMIGFVEPEPTSNGGWRWIAVDGPVQIREGFPSYEEALTDLIDALGGV